MIANQDVKMPDYWGVLRKRKFVFLTTFAIFLISSVVFTMMQAPVYRATVHVRIENSASGEGMTPTFMKPSRGEIIASEAEKVRSPDTVKIVAEKAGLIKDGFTEEQVHKVVFDLIRRIQIRNSDNSNMMTIDVDTTDPVLATDLANLIAETYKELHFSNKTKEIRESRQFIEEQLSQAQENLARSEEILRNYKKEHGMLSLDSETNVTTSQLHGFEGQLLKVKEQMANLEKDIARFRESYESGNFDVTVELIENPTVNSIQEKIESTRRQIATLSQLYTDKYPELIEKRQKEEELLDQLSSAIKEQLDIKLAMMNEDLEMLRSKEDELKDLVNKELADDAEREMHLTRLTRDVSVNEELYVMLMRELKEAKIREKVTFSEVKIVSRAILPKAPIKPNKKVNILVGVVVGMIFGFLCAILVEMIDTSFGSVEEVETELGVSVLAIVPKFKNIGKVRKSLIPGASKSEIDSPQVENYRHYLPSIFEPRTVEAEAYRSLRARLVYRQVERKNKVFLITSTGTQEGKSITALNLSVTFALNGAKTVLLSCDLRKPTIHRRLMIDREPGLAEIISGSATLDEAVHTFPGSSNGGPEWDSIFDVHGIENLSVITAGMATSNPVKIIDSSRMDSLIAELRNRYEYIFIDTPPALAIADALLLASRVDSVLLVYSFGQIPRRGIIRARNLFQDHNVNISGIVLNNVSSELNDLAQIYTPYRYIPGNKSGKSARKKAEEK